MAYNWEGIETRNDKPRMAGRFAKSFCWNPELTGVCFWNLLTCLLSSGISIPSQSPSRIKYQLSGLPSRSAKSKSPDNFCPGFTWSTTTLRVVSLKFRLPMGWVMGWSGGRGTQVDLNIRKVIFAFLKKSLLALERRERKDSFSMCRSLQVKNWRHLQER